MTTSPKRTTKTKTKTKTNATSSATTAKKRTTTARSSAEGKKADTTPARKLTRPARKTAAPKVLRTAGVGPTTEEIARRAYELWEQAGHDHGMDVQHWLNAEQDLLSR